MHDILNYVIVRNVKSHILFTVELYVQTELLSANLDIYNFKYAEVFIF